MQAAEPFDKLKHAPTQDWSLYESQVHNTNHESGVTTGGIVARSGR